MKHIKVKLKTDRFGSSGAEVQIKTFDTTIKTIEKQYGVDLGVRGDMKLGNYLKKKGYPSLAKMLENT